MKKAVTILDNLRLGILSLMVCFLVLYNHFPEKNWICKHGFELAIGCLGIVIVLSLVVEQLQKRLKSVEKRE